MTGRLPSLCPSGMRQPGACLPGAFYFPERTRDAGDHQSNGMCRFSWSMTPATRWCCCLVPPPRVTICSRWATQFNGMSTSWSTRFVRKKSRISKTGCSVYWPDLPASKALASGVHAGGCSAKSSVSPSSTTRAIPSARCSTKPLPSTWRPGLTWPAQPRTAQSARVTTTSPSPMSVRQAFRKYSK